MEKDKGDFKYLTVMYIILIVITLPIVFFMRPVILENIECLKYHISLVKSCARYPLVLLETSQLATIRRFTQHLMRVNTGNAVSRAWTSVNKIA